MAGRPREFDPEEAIAAAKGVFWRLGYEGASMQEIERATGLKKQSLYRAFGDKRGLYLASLDHYGRHEVRAGLDILTGAGTARERVRALFDIVVEDAASGRRLGCLVCSAGEDRAMRDEAALAAIANQTGRLLYGFFVALSVSDPYAGDETRRLAKASELLAQYFGLRVMSRGGAPVELVRQAADAGVAGV